MPDFGNTPVGTPATQTQKDNLRSVIGAQPVLAEGPFVDGDKDKLDGMTTSLQTLTDTLRLGGPVSGGVYSVSSAVSVAHDAALNSGTTNFALICGTITLSDWTPSARVVLAHKSDTADPATADEGWILALETSGKLSLYVPQVQSTPIAQTTSAIPNSLADSYNALQIAFSVNRAGQTVTFFVGDLALETVATPDLGTGISIAGTSDLVLLASRGWLNGYPTYYTSEGDARILSASMRNPDLLRRSLVDSTIVVDNYVFGSAVEMWPQQQLNVTHAVTALVEGRADVNTITLTGDAANIARRARRAGGGEDNTMMQVVVSVLMPASNIDADGFKIIFGLGGFTYTVATATPGVWYDLVIAGASGDSTLLEIRPTSGGSEVFTHTEGTDVIQISEFASYTVSQAEFCIDLAEAGVTKTDLINSHDATRTGSATDTL